MTRHLIACALFGAYSEMTAAGVNSSLMSSPYNHMFDAIREHYIQYKTMPNTSILLELAPGRDIKFKPPKQPWRYYWDRLVSLRKKEDVERIHSATAKMWDKMNLGECRIDDIQKMVEHGYRDIHIKYDKYSGNQTPMLFGQTSSAIEKDYEERKAKIMVGCPFAFSELDSDLMGLRGGELTVIAGRPNTGKSWIAVMEALASAEVNKRVLFVSCEMPVWQITHRLALVKYKLSAKRYKKGELSAEEEAKLRAALLDLPESTAGRNINIVPSTIARDPFAVEAHAIDFGADLVIIDAFYMMAPADEERQRTIPGLLKKIKECSLSGLRNYFITTQQSRSGPTKKSAGVHTIAYSDAFGQDASVVFTISQTAAEREMEPAEMVLTNNKNREGDHIPPFRFVWDFINMNWDLITIELEEDE